MTNRTKGKIVSVVLLGIVITTYFRFDDLQTSQRGREDYIRIQRNHFDQDLDHPRPLTMYVFASVICFGGLFGSYELIAFCVAKLLDKKSGIGRTD